MAPTSPPDCENHAFIRALAGLLDVALKHYLIQGAHKELEHPGTGDECTECGPLLRSLDRRGSEERERLYVSMRDFADRFGY